MGREGKSFKFVVAIFAVVAVVISLLIGLLISRGVKSAKQNQFAGEMSSLSEELGKSDTASTKIGKSVEQAEDEEDEQLGYELPILNKEKNDTEKSSSVETNSKNATEKSSSVEANSENVTDKNSNTEKNSQKEENANNSSKDSAIETNSKSAEKEEKIELEAPIKGEILREFAKDSLVFSNTLQEWVTHNGIDIKADKTSVVKAASNGTVSAIKKDPRYGLTVIINHDNGYQTIYSNLLTAEFVVKGEKVKIGQTIGTVGNSAAFEIEDEYHLHFELLKDNEYLDPTQFMSF